MKSSMRIQVIGRRSVPILAALLVVAAAFSLLTIGEMNAQSGPPEFLTAPELTATAKEGNVIELSWTPVSGAVRYDLWVWPGSNWEQLDDGALTDTTYSHTGLIAGTTYYYTVRAVPASGIPGVWSEFVGAIASETVPPTATPTSTATATPTATPTSTSTVTPTATARPVPPGQGHAPSPPGYSNPGQGPSIYPDGSSTEPGSGMPPPGYSNPGSGPSPPGYSNPGSGPSPPGYSNPGSGPSPPGSTGTGGGPVPPGYTNPGSGPSPPGYTAVPTATPTYTPTATVTPTPTSSATATSTPTSTPTLTPTSELTATPSATAPALNAPLLTVEATVRGIALSWEAADGVVRYELSTWWDGEAGWQMIGGDKLTGTTYTHVEVAAGTTYYYSIRAVNAAGETSSWLLEYPSATALALTEEVASEPTPTPTATEAAATVPPIPELSVRAREQGVEMSWEAVAGAVRYELSTWWDLEIGWQMIGGDDLAGTTYMHADVAAGTTYFYSIRAVNAEGEMSGWLLDYPSATAR